MIIITVAVFTKRVGKILFGASMVSILANHFSP
jgi:hypothetical protein